MGLSVGKLLIILVCLYLLLSTPWYIPKKVEPLILGIPFWAFMTILIILALGYALCYVFAVKIEKVIEHA